MAQYSEEWFYPTGALATNQRAIVFGPGDDNAVAPIFSDPAMTVPLANPTVTDANGMLEFYAPDGTYWIWVGPTTGGNGIEITLGASPDNPVLSVNGVAPDGGGNVTLTAADVDAQPITTINAAGDLYVGTGPDATTRLPIGAEGEVLTVTAGVPSWEPGGGGAVDSVNGQTGVVVLTASDVGADPAGSAAAAQAAAITASLQKAANLSDLNNPGTARTNLGLGNSATRNVGTTAGTVAAGDDTRIVNAIQSTIVDAAGDIIVATAADTVARLPAGSANEVLTIVAGVPSWEPAQGGAVDSVNGQTGVVVLTAGDVGAIPEAIMDAKGDIIAASAADTPVRVAVGANGTVLRANSAATPGVEWDTLDLFLPDVQFNDDRPVITAGNGVARWYNRGAALTIVGAWVSAGVVPTGADIIVDVNVNGSTIYSTQANRPTVPATTNGGAISATPDTTALAVGDYLTVDIDQIGSTIAGGRIVVGIVVQQTV